jgi:hypothetical protein
VPGTAVLDDQDRLAINVVVDDLRKTLVEKDPLDARRLERLNQVAKLRGLASCPMWPASCWRAGHAGGAGEGPRPGAPLSLGTVTSLMAGDDSGRCGWSPSCGRSWARRPARFEGPGAGPVRGRAAAPGHRRAEPRLKWLEAAALGHRHLAGVHVAAWTTVSVVALDAPEPTLIIGRGVLGGRSGLALPGRAGLFLLHQRAATVERLPMAQLDEILWGAAMLSGARPPGVDATALKARAKALGKGMGRKEMKALETYRPRLETDTPDGAACGRRWCGVRIASACWSRATPGPASGCWPARAAAPLDLAGPSA